MDEVAAEHVGADCIVHYGGACLSPSKRLPLMYVFETRPVDLEKCTSAFRELYPDSQTHIIVLYDVNYVHAISKPFSRAHWVACIFCCFVLKLIFMMKANGSKLLIYDSDNY